MSLPPLLDSEFDAGWYCESTLVDEADPSRQFKSEDGRDHSSVNDGTGVQSHATSSTENRDASPVQAVPDEPINYPFAENIELEDLLKEFNKAPEDLNG